MPSSDDKTDKTTYTVAAGGPSVSVVVPSVRKRRSSSTDNSSSAVAASTTTTTVASVPFKKARSDSATATIPKPLEKSTVTTVATAPALNAFDAVLAEASDLWQAASEAQQLGRLKMASSYLLLLHARLVGLGKRFDKAERPPGLQDWPPLPPKSPPSRKKGTATSTPSTSTSSGSTILTPNTAKVLEQLLPQDIELDQAMMEHLAKAAAELHAARCGGGRHKMNAIVDAYPPSAYSNVSNNNNNNSHYAYNDPHAASSGIVWSLQEIRILQQAMQQPQGAAPPNPEALAAQLGRNPAQVRAFLRNQNTKSRIAADLALETTTTTTTSGGPPGTPGAHKDKAVSSAAMTTTTPGGATNSTTDTPRRKGGRGPKPPTTALHTVPNAECNAHLLLKGAFLASHEDPENLREEPASSSSTTGTTATITTTIIQQQQKKQKHDTHQNQNDKDNKKLETKQLVL